MGYKFVVATRTDHVGVAIQAIHAAEPAQGFFLDDGSTLEVIPHGEIPLGHKIALRALTDGSPIEKYGEIIGTAVGNIASGEHVHSHNLKSQR